MAGRSHAADIRAGKHNNLGVHPLIPKVFNLACRPVAWSG